MDKNYLKFVSIPDAMEEIKTTLLMQSDFKKREELEPILWQLEDLQIRKDTKKVPPGQCRNKIFRFPDMLSTAHGG